MIKKLKSIPKFRDEAEERRFWETHFSTVKQSRTRPLGQSQGRPRRSRCACRLHFLSVARLPPTSVMFPVNL